jgi:ATP-dependent RNA circularization protein (DNA/RNA ligase family)
MSLVRSRDSLPAKVARFFLVVRIVRRVFRIYERTRPLVRVARLAGPVGVAVLVVRLVLRRRGASPTG